MKQHLLKSMDKSGEIEKDLDNLIRKNELKPGDRIASENTLGKIYNANLYQVRKAIRNLTADGKLYSKSRSGVFVSSCKPRQRSQPASSSGLNLFEIVGVAKRTLNFMVGCWDILDTPYWEKIAHEYSRQNGTVEIIPLFPRNYEEYLSLQKNCDMMYTTPWELLRSHRNHEKLAPFTLEEAASWPVLEKYWEHLVHGAGVVGIPVTSVFLVGSIADQFVPGVIARQMLSARDWEELFSIFEKLKATSGSALPVFNLHHLLVLNSYHFLRIAGGELLDQGKSRIDMGSPGIVRALELIDRYRNTVIFHGQNLGDCKFLVDIFYDTKNALAPWRLKNTPWLYPVQNDVGEYPEAQGIGCVFKHSHNIEEAKKFLAFLHTAPIQEILNDSPTSNGIAESVQDKIFNKYPAAWRNVLKKMKERTFVFGEYFPGYNEFLHNVFHPEMKRFFSGGISVGEFVDIAQEGADKIISKYEKKQKV